MQKNRIIPLVVANWKMNGLLVETVQFLRELHKRIQTSLISCEVLICPPFTLLRDFADKIPGSGIKLGAQNCHHEIEGSYTGEISAKQLKDLLCEYVIIGHSERRKYNLENNKLIKEKIKCVLAQGLIPILCVGETADEKAKNLTKKVISKQLKESLPDTIDGKKIVIAYEPVWAIGSGETPSNDEIEEIHSFIRYILYSGAGVAPESIRILYGGSVSQENAKEIVHLPNVNGLLIGKASLNVESFWNIVTSTS